MLSIELCGLSLRNPTILASGILGSTGATLNRVARNGAGAVVTKSIGAKPRDGYPNPTVLELRQGLLNAIGLANPGYNNFEEEIKVAKRGGVPIIVSIFGFDIGEFVEVAKAVQNFGADAVELNLSCPHVKETGAYFGTDPEITYELVKAIKREIKIPVIPKLTANVNDIVEIAKACEDAGCDGITAINTLRAMQIDIRAKKPVLGNKVGGLSGPMIKPIAVRCVYEIANEVEVPIVGCGGIINGQDAVEFILAGASAVEIGTGIYFRGISIFEMVCNEISSYMKEEGYETISEMVGAAL
jgi:dihydroorotate dehydrogenase (NAD+) catalytic subunit